MAIKDYWLYQKRNVSTPWAIYFVKEYDKRYNMPVTLDWTFYHENIPNQMHSKSFIGLHYSTAKGYADAITAEMAEYVEIEASDYDQVLQEVERICF